MILQADGQQYVVHFFHDHKATAPKTAPPETRLRKQKKMSGDEEIKWIRTSCKIHVGLCAVKKCPDPTVKLAANAETYCSPLDQFNKSMGRIKSFTRAVEKFNRNLRKQFWIAYLENFYLPGPRPFDFGAEVEFCSKLLMEKFSSNQSMEDIRTVAHTIAKHMEARHGK